MENDKIQSVKPFSKKKSRPCVFEYIYFARPDSLLNGKSAYEYRKKNLGYELAKESENVGEIVVPVPDSGVPAALGFSQYKKMNFELGLIRIIMLAELLLNPRKVLESWGKTKIKCKYVFN